MRDFVARDGHAGGSPMSSEPQQVLPRLSERAVKIEFRDRPARSFALIARERDQHRRSSKLFDQSGRHDTDHAWVPSVVGENDSEYFVEVHRQYFLAGLLERRVIDVLTPLIQL